MLGNSVAEKPSMYGPREMKVTLLFGIATCVTNAMAQHSLSLVFLAKVHKHLVLRVLGKTWKWLLRLCRSIRLKRWPCCSHSLRGHRLVHLLCSPPEKGVRTQMPIYGTETDPAGLGPAVGVFSLPPALWIFISIHLEGARTGTVPGEQAGEEPSREGR